MKVFALSILGLALAVPAARAENRDTSMTDTSKATEQQQGTDASKATAQQGTDASKSTAQSSDTSKAMPMDKSDKDRPAAARRDLGKSDDCMCECNGKMVKGKKGHPMGRSPANMDRSRPSSATEASGANAPASPNAAPADKSTDTSSQPSKGTGEMNPGSSDKADSPSNPR